MKTRRLPLFFILIIFFTATHAKTYDIQSPNKQISLTVGQDGPVGGIWYQVNVNGREAIHPSPISMTIRSGASSKTMRPSKIRSCKTTAHQENFNAMLYRQKQWSMAYNEAIIRLDQGFQLTMRVYDEGVCYRFSTSTKAEYVVMDEQFTMNMDGSNTAWLSYSTNAENPYAMAFQATYKKSTLAEAEKNHAFLPVTVATGPAKITLLEAELKSYPGMFVIPDANGLHGKFAPYPKTMAHHPWRGMTHVGETEDYISKSEGPRTFPWRVMAITTDDRQMPVNNLVYALSEPCKISDTSWIRPGKVAWDWWNDWNLRGVDFKAGINTRTYKYYIDFASKNHIPYVVLDEGWYDSSKGDLLNPIADIDLKGLIDYGKERNVSIILWTVFNVLDENLEEACKKYSQMGAKGFKVDFLDRDDQTATEMAYRLAETCAKYKMMLDYHGYYKPTGMSRTWPNILNYEGVFGMEEARWAKKDTDMPLYDVTFPFIRMMAGNVDFTPGALRNGTRGNWVMCYEKPVSMGTRCHQLACYVVHDSPFTMLCDAPTNYEMEQETTDFITSIPDEFDRTIIPQGTMGEYIVSARQKGSDWYVGGQTNWDGRAIDLKLDFLDNGTYTATIVSDGPNANHNAEDYAVERKNVSKDATLHLNMASGGGFIIIIKKQAIQ